MVRPIHAIPPIPLWLLFMALLPLALSSCVETTTCEGTGCLDPDGDLSESAEPDAEEEPEAESSRHFARAVTDWRQTAPAAFGADRLPDVVLGPPVPGDGWRQGTDVLSLGDGGWIILDLGDCPVVDGPGDDLIVYENAFYVGGDESRPFVETGLVSVSDDGVTFVPFPFDFNPTATEPEERYKGLAGVSPFGDFFDLATIHVVQARFIKIQDTGQAATDNAALDPQGEFLDDSGNSPFFGGPMSGFDLDAVEALHTTACGGASNE